MFYFIEEKSIQGIAEQAKWKVSGTVGVRFFYSLLKITGMRKFTLHYFKKAIDACLKDKAKVKK